MSSSSSSTMTKLRKGEDVSMGVLSKICIALNCNIADIVEFIEGRAENQTLYENERLIDTSIN